ncbi:MAG TPA: adenine deaminase [Dehalococcoidia bacterium]|nr:adenine deaminase [Dehalococcoidia bacterium]
MSLEKLISVARGDATADLLLTNARIVNTFTAEIEDGNVAIHQGRIAGIGEYNQAKKVIDLRGRYVAPGLIDGHIHIESSLLHPAEYARAVVPRGVSAVVTDFHEMANVTGLKGLRYLMDCTRPLPMDFYFMAPSCVPATHLDTAGAELGPEEIRTALRWKGVIGLGEMMNFPGVIHNDPGVLQKIKLSKNKVLDGHAPGLSGRDLNAYLSAGIGSDHESTDFEEGREKLRRGMYLMIREGSSEENLDELLPLVTDKTYKRCFFVVDDRTCADLLQKGDIDAVVRKAIARGLDPIRALQMATINTAEFFRQHQVGGVAPGYIANLIVISDLSRLVVDMVFYRGKLVAKDGEALFSTTRHTDPGVIHTVTVKPFSIKALKIPAAKKSLPVIEVVPGQVITRKIDMEAKTEGDSAVPDTERDILKLAVVERHRASGNIGLGFVKGFGLKEGALGSSIAHDSHNIIVVGTNDEDIVAAIKEIERLQGGLAVAKGGAIRGSLALPIAGLLSDEPLQTVVAKLEELQKIAANLGCSLPHPFATLSFLALPVIPELRLTDKGLVDVLAFKLLD